MLIKLLDKFVPDTIVDSYNRLADQIQWTDYGHKGKQAGLQYKVGEDFWTSAVGKSQGLELEYNNLNPLFKDTVFEELIAKYNLKRTRLMWVGPYACYSMHHDTTPRVHFPLITNPECYFLFKQGSVHHLSTGIVYWVDTTKAHTFINCSAEHRLHLVGVVES